MMNHDILFGLDGIGDDDVIDELDDDLDVQKYLQRALANHVDDLHRENEELQYQNRQLRRQLSSVTSPSNSNQNSNQDTTAEHGNLSFTFTSDNPTLQMDELTKEMELLRMTELSDTSDAVSCSMGVDSGNNSEFGSRLSLSAVNDMSRVQRCQRKIGELDKEAERARQYNRNLMAEFAEQLKEKSRILGEAVSKARPYYDALRKSKKTKQKTHHLANQYTRAQQVLRASRELVNASEKSMMNDPTDMQWLEMLNEANDKANQASREKGRIQSMHEESAQNYRLAEEVAAELFRMERKSIKKASSYFELKAQLEAKLEESRKTMQSIDLRLVEAKAELSASLQRLGKQKLICDESTSSQASNTESRSTIHIPLDDKLEEIEDDSESDTSIAANSIVDGEFFEDF